MSKKMFEIEIRQIKSAIGRQKDQEQTLIGLGLGSIGKVSIIKVLPTENSIKSIKGMINKVSHLVEVKEI